MDYQMAIKMKEVGLYVLLLNNLWYFFSEKQSTDHIYKHGPTGILMNIEIIVYLQTTFRIEQ